MGDLIVPRKYRVIRVDKVNCIPIVEETEVAGRKISLRKIRKDLLQKSLSAGVVRYAQLNSTHMKKEGIMKLLGDLDINFDSSKDEDDLRKLLIKSVTQRHILFWIDHASVLSQGHLLMTAKILYDKRFFLTDDEVKGKFNVQQLVEDPQVYMLARCRDTLIDKLMYSETRLEDILSVDKPINDEKHGVVIRDVVKFFSGDHPELQTESGQQIGGNFPCNGCQVPAHQFKYMQKTTGGQFKSIADRYEKVRPISF